MASYSCTTDAWGSNTAPRIRLTLTESSSTNTTATYSWKLEYVAQSPAYSVARPYTADIDGTRVASGKYEIDKKKGTFTIASGTKTFNKGTSSRTVVFSCSMNFSITWLGTYGGTMSKSGSFTLPAKIIPTYTISYNANGGSGAPSSQTKKNGETLKLSSTKPTRTGYSFLGWSTSSSATSASYSAGGNFSSNANTTLYAVWRINTYTISYNANGGSGAPSSQTKKNGETLKLSSTKPTRTGYSFLGWSTSSSATSATYNSSGSFTLNSNTTLYAVWSLAYKKPVIQNLTISRCNENGTFMDSGTSISVKFNWTTFNNLSSIQAWYKKATDTSWNSVATISGSSSQKSGSINTIIFNSLINADNTYRILIRVSDSGGYTDSTKLVNSQFVLMDFKNTGKGMAVGKVAEIDNLLDINLRTRHRVDEDFMINAAIYGMDADGNTYEALYPRNSYGNTIIGYGNYNAKSGDTNIYGKSVNIAVSETPNPASFKPYVCKGDTLDFDIATTGYITSGSTDICFFIPCSRYILGNPTPSAVSINGLIIRQGGKYTHGSSASVYVKPSSYSVSIAPDGGFYVIVTMSTTTNAINNDACGVRWSGKIVLY